MSVAKNLYSIINVRHFTVGLGYEVQHAFKGVIENKALMHSTSPCGYTF